MISIVTAIYRGEEYLPKTIESVLSQSYSEWEWIIGVNGWGDEQECATERIGGLVNDSRIRVVDMRTQGKCATLNQMMSLCSCEYVCLLDCDDIWHSKKLEKQIVYKSDYDVVGTNCIFFGDLNVKPRLHLGVVPPEALYEYNTIINSSAMFNKCDALWDVEFEGVDDYDMWLRILAHGGTFFNLPEILTYYRFRQGSVSRQANHDRKIVELKRKWIHQK